MGGFIFSLTKDSHFLLHLYGGLPPKTNRVCPDTKEVNLLFPMIINTCLHATFKYIGLESAFYCFWGGWTEVGTSDNSEIP